MTRVGNIYSEQFYTGQRSGSRSSAEIILPIVLERVRPESVIDVGCGLGTWLAVARSLGISRTLGLEGVWIQSMPLADSSLELQTVDLEQPLDVWEKFDLVLCMEVAEHLTPARARSFVRDLCGLAPHVLFSAAVPGQGGTNHLNEQWQSYWAALFREYGYYPVDVVRPAVWSNGGVDYWYCQNSLLYSKDARPDATLLLDVVHPRHGQQACDAPAIKSLREAVRETYKAASCIPDAALRAIRARLWSTSNSRALSTHTDKGHSAP